MSDSESSLSSFAGWLSRLRHGEQAAEYEVFDRFVDQLRRLAAKHLDDRVRRVIDPDDVTQSAFRSFFVRFSAGKFHLESWGGVWRLMAVIAVRKSWRYNEVVLRLPPAAASDDFSCVLDRQPAPEEVAVFVETVEEVMRGEKPRGRQILTEWLQGYTQPEIGERLGCSERTVRRTIQDARTRLERMERALSS